MLPEELRSARIILGFNQPYQFARKLGVSTEMHKKFEFGYQVTDNKVRETLPPLFLSYSCGWLLLAGNKRPPWPITQDKYELKALHKNSNFTMEDLGKMFGCSRYKISKILNSKTIEPAYFGFVIAWIRLYGTLDPFPNTPTEFKSLASINPFLGNDL